MKCLLVDDVEDNLMILKALLEDQDVEILMARSGRQALELLLEHEVALALLDVQMPEMDGFELAELMRGAAKTRDVPIIFVTAGSRDQLRLFKGYELGAVDFLYKPIDQNILRSKTSVFFQLYRQRQQLAEQLEERTATLRTTEMFMAILSHDLRNPLNAILTGAEVLHMSQDDSTRKTAGRIRRSGQRMTVMIQELLDLARSRLGGGIAIVPQPVNLAELVKRVAAEHQPAAGGSNQIEVAEAGNLDGLWDPGRMEQVVSNLIGNALTHGPAEGTVRIELDGSLADRVMISVSNVGSIPVSARERLFDPFSNPERTRSGEGGLGLGLYIVQQIIQAHGGSVTPDLSEPERTTFRAEVPRQSGR